MQLRVKLIDLNIGRRMVLLHEKDALEIGVLALDWVKLAYGKQTFIAFIDVTQSYLQEGEIGLFKDFTDFIGKDGDLVSISHAQPPESIEFVRKRVSGESLTKEEYSTIIKDVVDACLAGIDDPLQVLPPTHKPPQDMEFRKWQIHLIQLIRINKGKS